MARGRNLVILLGNCGQDPEVRYTSAGSAITTISVATTESWKDKDGNKQERTEWNRVVFFGKLAEIAGEYLKKGSQVYVEGKLRTNKWQAKDGTDRYTTEIMANEMQMLGGKDDRMSHSGSGDNVVGNKVVNQSPKAQGGGQTDQRGQDFGDPASFQDDSIPF